MRRSARPEVKSLGGRPISPTTDRHRRSGSWHAKKQPVEHLGLTEQSFIDLAERDERRGAAETRVLRSHSGTGTLSLTREYTYGRVYAALRPDTSSHVVEAACSSGKIRTYRVSRWEICALARLSLALSSVK